MQNYKAIKCAMKLLMTFTFTKSSPQVNRRLNGGASSLGVSYTAFVAFVSTDPHWQVGFIDAPLTYVCKDVHVCTP